MKYEKPEVLHQGEAIVEVQGLGKIGGPADSVTHEPPNSVPAYEADE